MKLILMLLLSMLVQHDNAAHAAEVGDEFVGPWRGYYGDEVVDAVPYELYLWRQRPGMLFGIARYGTAGCWKRLFQTVGRRIAQEGVEQPVWFEERADPPNSNCGHLRGISTVLVGRRKDNVPGFSSGASIEWVRLDREEKLLAAGRLQGLPTSSDMEQAVREQWLMVPPSAKAQ